VEHLGLEAALEARADAATSQGRRDVVVRVLGDSVSLPDALATGAYRIVEDAISTSPRGPLAVSLTVADAEVGIVLQLPSAVDEATLAPIRSRAELLGGALDVLPSDAGGTRVVARVRRHASSPAA
jgi:signal transduction histidine kinase